ncbi:uncharacterized protein LOC132312042 [Cornus florida]|uniref:uncharacterized protein LOC132312042 n=1 Tax=Cornus florida TaxID=4283 RepID=UPI0028A09684|nr:uncharacterized protein LOC132312042 [Cornus florida]
MQKKKMRSLSGVGLGLSLVFGCLLLALIGELYYLLWWKKRLTTTNRDIEREFLYTFCCKKPSSLTSTALDPQQLSSAATTTITDTHVHDESQSHDFWFKPFGEDTELMRLQSLSGPPRFLFTIKEETKEDLESEDDNNKSRSLSDLLLTVETPPFLTPLASPSCFTPPLTPMDCSHSHHKCKHPKFESSSDAEFNRIRSSPPPKFKFLRDAEDKLHRRKMMDEAPSNSMGSSVTLIVAN